MNNRVFKLAFLISSCVFPLMGRFSAQEIDTDKEKGFIVTLKDVEAPAPEVVLNEKLAALCIERPDWVFKLRVMNNMRVGIELARRAVENQEKDDVLISSFSSSLERDIRLLSHPVELIEKNVKVTYDAAAKELKIKLQATADSKSHLKKLQVAAVNAK